jgi:ferredoxin
MYQVIIKGTDDTFNCAANRNVLKAMEQLGRKGIPVGCRGGGCGVCKVRILTGEYRCRKMSRAHVSEEEQEKGYVLACRCEPQSNLVIEIAGEIQKSIL